MDPSHFLVEAYGRIGGLVSRAVEGLDTDALSWRPEPGSNSIAWLVWHLTRIQDDHVSELAAGEQTWIADGWHDRLGLPFAAEDTGYGHGPDQVAAVRQIDGGDLVGYYEAVAAATRTYLGAVTPSELDRIIDHSYDPPVSVGVRLASVLSDNLQHAGQALYLRGMLQRGAAT